MENQSDEERKLKTVRLEQIEDAISDALEKLLKFKFRVNIKMIDFEPKDATLSILNDTTLITLEASRPLDLSGFIKKD